MTKIVETNSVMMHHGARESRRVSDILIPPYETTCNIPYHATPPVRARARPAWRLCHPVRSRRIME